MQVVKENRYVNLLLLIEEAGSVARLEEKTGITANYLRQIKNKNAIQNGKPKGIGDKIAAKLEDGMGKERGWLDKDHSQTTDHISGPIYLKENVQYLMNKKGMDLAILAKRTHIDEERLQALFDSDDNLTKETPLIKTLANYFIVSENRLLYDNISLNPRGVNILKVREAPVNQVPIRGYAQLGTNKSWVDLEYPVGQGDGYIWWPSRDPDAYALKCQGDSMQPRIKHNEYAIIEPGHPVNNGDEVLVVTDSGEVMVKTFAYEQGGRVTLLSVNESHEAINLYRENIKKIHYLAGITKESLVIDL
ncbi:S24 family peptidase [Glaesserella parasuis]|nr:S24 family peptidase [Glaesserella parasuis]MDO9966911.1 S24 family peptidase [Glaesserella parasuis]MDO9969133.1 S24 family peptidase [Glaesserella parasuis]MDO9971293.1 S24 family peptidase [Glaesserella parasuis]MDP0007286.1 S24 family peptidase [Glaesserella parasuis]